MFLPFILILVFHGAWSSLINHLYSWCDDRWPDDPECPDPAPAAAASGAVGVASGASRTPCGR